MSQENKIKKGKIYIILLFALGAVFIILGTVLGGNKMSTDNEEEYVKNMECKLEDFLLDVKGIKKVDVIISAEFKDIGDKTEINIIGAAVACTNGNDDKVKEEITDIVSKYLGIGANKVKITGIKQ